MASSSKRQTTMAKIAREQAVRERRVRKQEKREARKRAAAGQDPTATGEETPALEEPSAPPGL